MTGITSLDQLNGDQLHQCIHTILKHSAAETYSLGSSESRIEHYNDGSVAYIYTAGHWECRRVFYKMRFSSKTLCTYSNDLTVVSLGHEQAWHMLCSMRIVSADFIKQMSVRDLLMRSFRPLAGALHCERGPIQFREPELKLLLTRSCQGTLEYFEGTEEIMTEQDCVSTATFVGSLG